jgi:hypothetical protein
MKDLWKALLARLVYWLTPKPPVPPPAPIVEVPEPPLTPGRCECGHLRCVHLFGKERCGMNWPPSEKWPTGSHCGCQVFIRKKNDDDGEVEPETPSPAEL